MRVMGYAALFSGGKDSVFAVFKAIRNGIDVDCLVTMIPENRDSYMFHSPALSVTPLQSETMGIRHFIAFCSGEKEAEVDELQNAIETVGASGIITGAITSSYQMNRIEHLCRKLHLDLFAPLWRTDEESLLREFLCEGFEAIFVSVAADGLDMSWLGRRLDEESLSDLMNIRKMRGINLSGEGGEYETLVLDGPIFGKRIALGRYETEWKGGAGRISLDCGDVRLVAKRINRVKTP